MGQFQATSGLHGSWTLFRKQYTATSAGGLRGRFSGRGRPQPASSTVLDWDSAQPLKPIAVVANPEQLAELAGGSRDLPGYRWLATGHPPLRMGQPSRALAPQISPSVQPTDPERHAEPASHAVASAAALSRSRMARRPGSTPCLTSNGDTSPRPLARPKRTMMREHDLGCAALRRGS
jgi:hypothetical protein